MRRCVFCGTAGRPSNFTDEHAIPKWARDAFDIRDWVTIMMGRGPDSPKEQVRRLRHLNIVLRKQLCHCCNNEWLGGLERSVRPILEPMALLTAPQVTLNPAGQRLMAL